MRGYVKSRGDATKRKLEPDNKVETKIFPDDNRLKAYRAEWAQLDSNQRPSGYEPEALTN